MKKINQVIMREAVMLMEILKRQYSYREDDYSFYHSSMLDYYEYIKQSLFSITNYSGSKDEDFIIFIANAPLSNKQIQSLLDLRKEPIYIKAMGEAALLEKRILEKALDYEIHNNGEKFSMGRQAVKIPSQLEEEGNLLSSKLDRLCQEGKLDEKKVEFFKGQLFYIYQYYQSIAQGEQIPFKKYPDSFYYKIDQLAKRKGISFLEQFQQTMLTTRFQFEDLQRMQEDYYITNKIK